MSWSTWPGFRAGHRWEQANLPSSPDDDAPRQEWRRPLGLLELKFDLSTQRAGQSDTFLRLSVSLEPAAGEAAAKEAQNAFLSRMLLAWTLARARHPLLAATVHDSAEAHSIPSVQAREFRYRPPTTAEEAIDEARETVLVHEGEGTVEEAMDEVQSRYILNGERVLLDQGRCLARLVLVRSEKSPERLGFFLVISHIISDGLSVFKLVNELFSLTSSPSLPTPSPPPTFRSLADYLSSAPTPLPPYEVPNEALSAWPLVLPPETLLSRLPLPNEEHYPVIPLPPSASPPVPPPASATELPSAPPSPPPSAPPSPQPSPARARWFWAFHRVLLTQRAERFPRTLFMPRLAYPEKPPQARTRWPQLRFSKETSAMLLTLCKREGVSPSMLLYSLISLSISRILAAEHPSAPYHPVIIGFPFSFRPFLLPSPPSAPPSSSGAAPTHSNPSSDLAIRITFWQIHLPSLPLDPNDPSAEKELRAAVMRGAKLAKRQFAERLAPEPEKRSAFIAEAYSLVLQRLLNGVGNNPIPYDEPKTALNASMIGDVDRLLPTAFPLPPPAVSSSSSSSPSSGQLRLSNLLIGTRLHNGEGLLLEALTWDGQITLCLGVDDGLVSSEVVERLLEGVREAGEVVARGEGAS
ncbi:hypothetical protein JCM6882_003806 [Rhodosporidiobolus microsporus]